MITITQKGDFKNTEGFLRRNNRAYYTRLLHKYGELGVDALRKATPVDTGKTRDSWSYEIMNTALGAKISWVNSNVVNGVPIAIILHYGHATRNGGYVKGYNYINTAIQPIFDKMSEEIWKEVTR